MDHLLARSCPQLSAPWTKFRMPRLDIPTVAPPLVRSSTAETEGGRVLGFFLPLFFYSSHEYGCS